MFPVTEADLRIACFGAKAKPGAANGFHRAMPSDRSPQAVTDPAGLRHSFFINFDRWPRRAEIVSAGVNELIDQTCWSGGISRDLVRPLSETVSRSFQSAVDLVPTVRTSGSVGISGTFELTPGRTFGARPGAFVAVASGVTVHRNGVHTVEWLGPNVDANLRAFSEIKDPLFSVFVQQACEGSVSSKQVFNYFQRNCAREPFRRLIATHRPMAQLTRDFQDFAFWQLHLQRPRAVTLPVGQANAFDLYHHNPRMRIEPGSDIDMLLKAAVDWLPSNDDAENTVRWLAIMSVYNEYALNQQLAEAKPTARRSRSVDLLDRNDTRSSKLASAQPAHVRDESPNPYLIPDEQSFVPLQPRPTTAWDDSYSVLDEPQPSIPPRRISRPALTNTQPSASVSSVSLELVSDHRVQHPPIAAPRRRRIEPALQATKSAAPEIQTAPRSQVVVRVTNLDAPDPKLLQQIALTPRNSLQRLPPPPPPIGDMEAFFGRQLPYAEAMAKSRSTDQISATTNVEATPTLTSSRSEAGLANSAASSTPSRGMTRTPEMENELIKAIARRRQQLHMQGDNA